MRDLLRYSLIALIVAIAAALGAGACGAVNNDDDDSSSDSDSDSDTDADTDSDSDTDTTIYDIRQGNVAEGTVVTVTDVIVTSPVHTTEAAVYIEEPGGGEYSAIHLYMWTEALAEHYGLMPGDVVDVTGEYAEFYGGSEIIAQSPLDIVVTGSADVPGPDVVAPADVTTGGDLAEPYESVLIKVEDVAVTDGNAGYGDFIVDDSLHVKDFFFEEGEGPSGPNITVADDDTFGGITGILHFAYDEFKLAPRDQDDYEDWSHQETTVYDLQQDNVDEGTVVTLEDVVVSSPVHVEDSLVFVQEIEGGQHSGILLYLYSEVMDAVDLEPGDVISVSGEYAEFYGMAELTVTSPGDLTETSSGPAPAPEVVLPADIATDGDLAEAYECVLVQVETVTVTNDSIGYGSFEVTDGLIVDDFFFAADDGPSGDMPAVAVDDVFNTLTGPLAYSFDEFRLFPRDSTDMDFQ